MGKKYIIELEDGESVYKTITYNGYPMIQDVVPAPYAEPDLEQIRKEAYQKGLSDAWEAAKKIQDTGGNLNWWIHHVSAPEAIEKIRQHEQEKDRQARIEYNFDEIKDVLETTAKECNVSLDEIAAVLQKMRKTE